MWLTQEVVGPLEDPLEDQEDQEDRGMEVDRQDLDVVDPWG